MVDTGLPHFAQGEVIKGFGRGSKELGIPTANFSLDVIDKLPQEVQQGVYFGYAALDQGPIYKMVMSIGWNPFYKNQTRSMETHILHKFAEDFYGRTLKVAVLGYIRPEKNFGSLEELIQAINEDIAVAELKLEEAEFVTYKGHELFATNQQ